MSPEVTMQSEWSEREKALELDPPVTVVDQDSAAWAEGVRS